MTYKGHQKQHIAQSGAKAGQWVHCDARNEACPLGGLHVDKGTLTEVQSWAGRRAWVDISQKDYEDYLKSKINGTLEEDRRPMETLEEKRARLGGERITKSPEERRKQPGTKFRDIQKLKGTMSTTEYYKKLFADYPEVAALTLSEKARVERVMDKTYGDPTKKVACLKDWISKGYMNDVDGLERRYANSDKPERRAQRKVQPIPVSTRPRIQPSPAPAQPKVRPAAAPRNQIADYAPLNDDSAATKAILDRLSKYEVKGQGVFGAKTKADKIVEYMVRNQLQFKGNTRDFGFEKVKATDYAPHVARLVDYNYQTIADITSVWGNYESGTTLKRMKVAAEKTVAQHNTNQSMQKDLHDAFVQASKAELMTTLIRKGHEGGTYSDQLAHATKASEIYRLRDIISGLKHEDEFSRAGL